jgi:hypothetical protein
VKEGVFDQTVLSALTAVLVGHAVETPGIWQDVGAPFRGVNTNTLLLAFSPPASARSAGAGSELPRSLPPDQGHPTDLKKGRREAASSFWRAG